MNILSFSCLRPTPDHIGEVLGQDLAKEGLISEYLTKKLVTLDISRALYLCAYSDGMQTWTSLIACVETEPNGGTKGAYQTEPIRVSYVSNIAIDTILRAATAAVPLYNVHNGAQQLVVWRISRPEAVEALQAAFSSVAIPALDTPYSTTMVELVADATMPTLPTGLFTHPAK